MAVTDEDEDEAAPAIRESLHPAEQAAFFGSRIASAGASERATPATDPFHWAAQAKGASRGWRRCACANRCYAQRIYPRTILKPQPHAALLDKKRGLLTRTRSATSTPRKVALHAEFSDLSMVQANRTRTPRRGCSRGCGRRELVEMR